MSSVQRISGTQSSLAGSLIDELYLLVILSKSPTNCDLLTGEAGSIPVFDTPKLIFQVFMQLETISIDFEGENGDLTSLLIFYCLVCLKNFGPISKNFDTCQYIDSRILRKLSDLMNILTKQYASVENRTEQEGRPQIPKSFGWREYSLFLMCQHVFAVTLRRRPDIRHQLRELKVLEETHKKYLGWPTRTLPTKWATYLNSREKTTNDANPDDRQIDNLCPMSLQVSIFEMLATAFLDLQTLERWSAIGGFKLFIDSVLWISSTTPIDADKIAQEFLNCEQPNTSSSKSAENVSKGLLPSLPGSSSPSDDESPSLLQIKATRANPAFSAVVQPGTAPAIWESINPLILRIFEAFFHMSLCISDSEAFNARIISTICGIFNNHAYQTPQNLKAREYIKKYPEPQLSFLCLLNSLINRNSKCLDEFIKAGIWDTILNSGFFIQTRTSSQSSSDSAQSSEDTTDVPEYPHLELYLQLELSRYLFKTIEYTGCLPGRLNDNEVMVLLTLLESPHTNPQDLEKCASVLLVLSIQNPIPTLTALINVGKHRLVLATSPANNPTQTHQHDHPFPLIPPPTLDEKRKNNLNQGFSGISYFMNIILKMNDLLTTQRESMTPSTAQSIENAKGTLILAINKLLSAESVRKFILTDTLILNDIFAMTEDPDYNIFSLAIYYIAERMKPHLSDEKDTFKNNYTFFQQLSTRFLDLLHKRPPSKNLAFEIAIMDSIASIANSSTNSADLQTLLYQGILKILGLIDKVVKQQSQWTIQEVSELVVASVAAIGSLVTKNRPNKEQFNMSGFQDLGTILKRVAAKQTLSKSLLYELIRIMMDGSDEVLLTCLGLDQLPNLTQRTKNMLLLGHTPAPKKYHTSVMTSSNLSNSSLASEDESAHAETSATSLAPLPAASTYESNETVQLEAFHPPNPKVAMLIFQQLPNFSLPDQNIALDVFLFLAQSKTATVTLSTFCAEGMLSKVLNFVKEVTDPSLNSKLFALVGALGAHSISVRDIGQVFSLFKPLPGDYRPPWTTPLLESLESMVAIDDSPNYYFNFDGSGAALVLPPLQKFPLGRGFSMATWLYIEDFDDPCKRPNYQPRILSFLDDTSRGFEFVMIKNSFHIFIHREAKSEVLTFNYPKEMNPVQARHWYFLTLTYSVSTSILSKQGTFKLHIGDKLVDKVSCKQISFGELTHCYVGSSYLPDEHKDQDATNSAANSLMGFSTNAVMLGLVAPPPVPSKATPPNNEEGNSYLRSQNRSFYGYMSEITFFDEEIPLNQIILLKSGESRENIRTTEWNAVFDGAAPSNVVGITMAYSPRSTSFSSMFDGASSGYSNPYKTDPSARFRHAPIAELARKAAGAPETSHICYDPSPFCRDAIIHNGLHVVHRKQLRSMISCVNGGSDVLLPLFQLLDKPEEMSAAQIVAKRERGRAFVHNTVSPNTPPGSSSAVLIGLTRSASPDSVVSSTASGPSSSPPASNTGDSIGNDVIRHAKNTTPEKSNDSLSRAGVRWSKATIPTSFTNSGEILRASTLRHLRHSPMNTSQSSLMPGSSSSQLSSDNGSPQLLRLLFLTTLKILHASPELQRQIVSSIPNGFEIISFLLVRAHPGNLSEKLLDIFLKVLTRHILPVWLEDVIIESILLEFHLWIYSSYSVQEKLLSDTLTTIFVTNLNLNLRYRLNLVQRLLEVIRTYYWEVGNSSQVMATELAVNPQTGAVIGQRPSLPQLRNLRRLIYNLISGIIAREISSDEDTKRELYRKETFAILQFLKECPDTTLVVELLDYLEQLHQKNRIYFGRFMDCVAYAGSSVLLYLLESRSNEVRAKTLVLINVLIQSREFNTVTHSGGLPIVFSAASTLPSPLVDFPIASLLDRLVNKPVDQMIYDAMVSLLLVLPPFYRGKYLIHPETGQASTIRMWPMLSTISRVLSGRSLELQSLFLDDFTFLITCNDINRENMMAYVPSWPLYVFYSCAKPISPIPEAPGSTKVVEQTITRTSLQTTPLTEYEKSQNVDVKAIDALKLVLSKALSAKNGAQYLTDCYCWLKVYVTRYDPDGAAFTVPEADYYESLFTSACHELVHSLKKEFESAFDASDGALTTFLKDATPSVTQPQVGTKISTLTVANAISTLLTIMEFALQTWPVISSVTNQSSQHDDNSSPVVHPSHTEEGEEHLNLALRPFNPDLLLTLFKLIQLLEDKADRLPGITINSPTDIFVFKSKSGFRGPGNCSVSLRILSALCFTNTKNSNLRPCFNNVSHTLVHNAKKISLSELCYSLYQTLKAIQNDYSSPTGDRSQSRADIFLSYISSLIASKELNSLLASSKHFDASFLEYLSKFELGAVLEDLINSSTMEPLLSFLRKKLHDYVKEEAAARKSSRSYLNKAVSNLRLMVNEEQAKEWQMSCQALDLANKAVEKYINAQNRILDPKTIRENYTNTAFKWRETLRALKGERGPWGNSKTATHWKLSNVESAIRTRPFFKKNYHFNDHKDATKAAKGTKTVKSPAQLPPSSVKMMTSYNLQGFLKSTGLEASTDGELINSTEAGASTPEEADDFIADSCRPDSRMVLTNPDGTVTMANPSGTSTLPKAHSRIVSTMIPQSHIHRALDGLVFTPQKSTATIMKTTCYWIRPMRVTQGTLEISASQIRFKPESIAGKKKDQSSSPTRKPGESNEHNKDLPRERAWAIEDIVEIRLRRYLLMPTAIELFFVDRTNQLLSFNGKERKDVFATLVKLCPPTTLAESRSPEQIWRSNDMTKKWQMRQVSNFEYLMYMNTLAGRTYNDLSQYPVFPWIINDMTSEHLDLNDPYIYRDLSKPVGALNPARLQQFIDRYDTFSETEEKYFYGTHYSTAAYVLFYLVRVEPFTSMSIELQDGAFDISDRMFNSIPQCWANCLNSTGDVKELIPEFFYMPDFLLNSNNFNLGVLHTGEQSGDVQLPPWAKNADAFVRTMRRALESDYVSEHLHEWIDLVFGYKQRGQEAINAHNVFHFMTYEGMVNLDEISDPRERAAAETMIAEFGQTPAQVLRKPHPPRGPGPVLETNSLDFNWRKDETFPAGSNRIGWVGVNSRRSEISCIDSCGFLRTYISNLLNLDTRLPNDIPATYRQTIGYDNPPRIIPPHTTQTVRTSCLSKDGVVLYSALHDDNTIKCISLDSYKTLASLSAHKDQVTCLALTDDGTYLISGSKDTTVRVWSHTARFGLMAPIMSLNEHDDEVVCVAANSIIGVVASSSKDKSIVIRDLNSGNYITSIIHPRGFVYDLLAISSLGYIIAYSNGDGMLYTYSLNGRLLHSEEASENPKVLLVTKDGEFLVTGGKRSSSGAIVIRRVASADERESYKPYIIAGGSIYSMAFSTDENYLIAGLDQGHILIKESPLRRLSLK